MIAAIRSGQRPMKPTGLPEELWRLVSTNWDLDTQRRLTAGSMLNRLWSLRGEDKLGESVF